MSEGLPLPQPDLITPTQETGSAEGLGNLITSLVEQQTNSYDAKENMLSNPRELEVYNQLMDISIVVPKIWQDTVVNVLTAYGSLIYERLPIEKQALFLWGVRNEQEERGGDLVLTQEEGGILKNIAHAVDIEYDPGTAENAEQKTFKLADIEAKAPDRSQIPSQYRRLLDQGSQGLS